ncbi:MAG: ATP-binding protein [Vicinamibacterales bacterium]
MPRPLRRQAAFLTLALLVPVLLAIAWAAAMTFREQVRQLQDQTTATAAIVATYIDSGLRAADALADVLALNPAVRALEPEGLDLLLPRLAGNTVLSNVVIAGPDGRGARWALPTDALIEGQLSPDWLRAVAASPRPLASALLGQPEGGRHVIVLGYAVRDDGGTAVAVLGLAVHLEALEAVLASIPLPDRSVVTVTDNRSVVLARSRDASRFVGRPLVPPEARRDIDAVPRQVVTDGADDVERAFGNHVVERGPWLVSVGIPTAVAWQRTAPIYERNVALVLVVALVLLSIQVLSVRRVVRAFEHLDRAADRVRRGDLSTPEAHAMPSAELARLQHTFIDMVDRQREASERVAEQVREERQVRRELQSLQRQVIRQERLAAIGVLVSGVAHELNNPLQAILGFAELLQMRKGLPPDVHADLGLIQKESARASAIIRNLSRFGRQQTGEPQEVRMRDIVASVIELRQRKIEESGIDLVVDERARSPVRAVFTELQQVLLNLVINAEQAVLASERPERRISIRTFEREGSVVVEVEDTGTGVPAEHEAKLFQPFFTTKPVGEGTGLGLSVSYGIVESHGGHLGYRAAASGGALFQFELPISPGGEERA